MSLVASMPTALAPAGEEPSLALVAVDAALVSERFRQRIPIELARDRLAISQGTSAEGVETLAVSGREGDEIVAHNIGVRLERPVKLRQADAESIVRALEMLSAETAPASAQEQNGPGFGDADLGERDIAAALAADEKDLLQTSGRAPVVRLVNALLFEALALGASDMHVQPVPEAGADAFGGAVPGGGGVTVRFRVDGALFDARCLPRRLLASIVSRIKVMAGMDIAERRLPQDGRAAVTIGRQEIDLRVSSLPTALGERVVIRLLDKRREDFFDLDRLGMPPEERAVFERVCERPHGMVLVTGPTGSGKTTTLYSALRKVATPERNVLTIEDPIEYELSAMPGAVGGSKRGCVSQSQINPKKGVTFATGLRHILRQDPDVIMVGEIRDAETARIAVQAALTGHLVFSTLHTNSAASAVTRLIDLGVEPYLINAAVSAVLAQRLVRTTCESCHGADPSCVPCRGTGLRGRLGLFELLIMDARLRELVARGGSAEELERAARRGPRPMRTLREAGMAAASAGLSTRAEVDRVTLLDDAIEDATPSAVHHATSESEVF